MFHFPYNNIFLISKASYLPTAQRPSRSCQPLKDKTQRGDFLTRMTKMQVLSTCNSTHCFLNGKKEKTLKDDGIVGPNFF